MANVKVGYSDDDGVVIVSDGSQEFDQIVIMMAENNYRYSIRDNPLRVCVAESDVDSLNKDLIPFQSSLEITEKFKKWVSDKKLGFAKIRVGPVFSKIITPKSVKLPHKDIEDVCKYFFKPSVRQKSFKEGRWDGYIHLYKKWLHTFPSGLLDDVCEVLDKKGIKYSVERTYEDTERMFDWEVGDNIIPDPDQIDAIEACYKAKRCVCKAPTGFGKVA